MLNNVAFWKVYLVRFEKWTCFLFKNSSRKYIFKNLSFSCLLGKLLCYLRCHLGSHLRLLSKAPKSPKFNLGSSYGLKIPKKSHYETISSNIFNHGECGWWKVGPSFFNMTAKVHTKVFVEVPKWRRHEMSIISAT